MDLGTISDRLKAGQYITAHAVQDDVIKVWRNVFRYEQSSSRLPLMSARAAGSSRGKRAVCPCIVICILQWARDDGMAQLCRYNGPSSAIYARVRVLSQIFDERFNEAV